MPPSRPQSLRRLSTNTAAVITCALIGLALTSSPALATPANDFSWFDGDSIALDFDEIAMPQSTVIDTQYAGYGVSFSPHVWFENHRGALGWDDHNIANFLTGTSTANPTVEFRFSTEVSGAAFEWASNTGSRFLLEALLGGGVVESLLHDQATCCGAQVLGFEDVRFDTLRVSHQAGSNLFIADRLTWEPVPEPSTGLLTGLGLGGLAVLRRSRARA